MLGHFQSTGPNKVYNRDARLHEIGRCRSICPIKGVTPSVLVSVTIGFSL